MDSRDSLDQTLDSIDLTESLVKHLNTQRQKQKINEDTSDDDIDEVITFDDDKVKKTYRRDIKVLRKRAKDVKTKKGRTTKMYTINVERKKLLKQRREKALQNARDRKIAKENFLAALKADRKGNRASNDIQSDANTNDELIDGSNTNIVTGVENSDNDVLNAENTDNAAINADKTSNNVRDDEKSDDVAMSNDNIYNTTMSNDNIDNAAMSNENTDNATMSDNNTDDAILGDCNIENTVMGETSAEDVPSPLPYGTKTTDPSKVKTSKRHIPIRVKPSEPSIDDPPPDKSTTETVKSHAFDPTDV